MIKSRSNKAAKSLATPICDSASGRLGVIAISKITSLRFNASVIGFPASSFSSRPLCPNDHYLKVIRLQRKSFRAIQHHGS